MPHKEDHSKQQQDEKNEEESGTFETMRNAALAGKALYPDQIDYYDPETNELK